ncbi:Protein Topaz1 [Manis pentadactyla]|nr:Protein Topaz1 [Manis pentadactyla]
MTEVAMRVTPVAAAAVATGGAGPGAESGSRASGLVRTRRRRRHIPGNGGARPGTSWAGRGLGAAAAQLGVGPKGDGQRAPRAPAAWERRAVRSRGRGGAGGAELGLPGCCVSGDGRLATIALFSAEDPYAF